MSGWRPNRPLGGPSLRTVSTQHRVGEFLDRLQRRARLLPMRLVSGARDHGYVDRAVAFILRDLDLAHGAILVIRALQDRHGHADIGEVFRNIPVAECWIEPGVVPAIEGVV